MKYKDKYNISKDYEDLFSFRDEKDELDYEAHMLMFRFLSEVEKNNIESKTMRNRDLASKLGVSPSYITQLMRGDKLMNFTMLAKIQKVFDITFEIKARRNESLYSVNNLKFDAFPSFPTEPEGFRVWRNLKNPDYTSSVDSCEKSLKGKNNPGESAA